MENSRARNPVKSAQTTLRIVEALRELGGAGVTELANHLDLPKSSVHNYLSTLEQEEYLRKDGHTYHVGLRFLELGSFARHQRPIYRVAKPEVSRLAEETGELANLLVEEHGRGVYVHRDTGDRAVKVDSYTGHRVYLHNTALGKAILAHLSAENVERILDRHGLPETTPRTITDRDELFDELETIRDAGVAFDREERLEGLMCVAAPIVSRDGGVEGAISISGPTSRMRGERIESELPDLLRSSVNVIELNITYG
jgi:DNA-binding IclR family transcriptional regulator